MCSICLAFNKNMIMEILLQNYNYQLFRRGLQNHAIYYNDASLYFSSVLILILKIILASLL